MFKLIAFVTFCAVLIQADPVPFKCGEFPWAILKCIDAPKVIKKEIADQCSSDPSECVNNDCVFKKMGWMNEEKVIDYSKISAYFDEVAMEYPLWADAVVVVKAECLGGNLPNLGTETNCPTYDLAQCSMARFIKSAKPSYWKNDAECEYPRQFVANCPICPKGCVAPYPAGLCNQCKA
ncbi:uncharacterized protein [Choristoneura fumiferana]|uniref:uncharacterized protein n=1 Tax=Choristoneura fumiferana TaxID=7141 RepID=UPI003D15AA83